MKNKYPKISVIVICYNQEDVIKRALDSVIIQKDYLYELIISDDHSSDQTWEIVTEYKKRNPNIIKEYRQKQNLGVYENLQSTYDKVTGELVFFLSGDDAFGSELFKETCKTLAKTNLDYTKDRFCVLTDYKKITPDGDESIIKTNSRVKKHNPLSLKLRGLIVNRALGESINSFNARRNEFIVKRTESKIPSTLQEGYVDTMPYSMSKEVIYLPIIGNLYYSGIGISTKFKEYKEMHLRDRIEYYSEISKYINNFKKDDLFWIKFRKTKTEFMLDMSFYKLCNYFYYLILTPKDALWKYYYTKELNIFVKNIVLYFKTKLILLTNHPDK